MLEVIRNHDQSRFLHGATIDETKLNDAYGAEATAHTSRVRYLHSEQATFESIRIPPGREVTWRDFDAQLARMRQALKALGAHHACEGIRPGLAAQAAGVLAREPGAGWAP